MQKHVCIKGDNFLNESRKHIHKKVGLVFFINNYLRRNRKAVSVRNHFSPTL
jgi:hypothetical protein